MTELLKANGCYYTLTKSPFFITCRDNGKKVYKPVNGYTTIFSDAATGEAVNIGIEKRGSLWYATELLTGYGLNRTAKTRKELLTLLASPDLIGLTLRTLARDYCRIEAAELAAHIAKSNADTVKKWEAGELSLDEMKARLYKEL